MVVRFFPADKWISHYCKLLEYFDGNQTFNSISSEYFDRYHIPPTQVGQIESTKRAFSRLLNSDKIKEISFDALEIPILDPDLQKHNPTFIIGGLITGNKKTLIKYSFSVCISYFSAEDSEESCCLNEFCNKKRIVRRFHFDYQPTEQENFDLKSHLQIGGILALGNYNEDIHYCLHNSLTKPRIPFDPWDFILLLDCMINQFETPLSNLIRDEQWIGFVKRSRDYMRDLQASA